MKYIGENAIKKLIALIKGDLATKQDSIAATGVLERDTTGVINGVETVGATLVETQEAKLVDVPNGLLKGDGTTISAAVAGTDYVNSSQAIRYDAAQTLTDAQKTQARENIAAAPDGFGLGVIKPSVQYDSTNGDNITKTGWYVILPEIVGFNIGYSLVRHENYSYNYSVQTLYLLAGTTGFGRNVALRRVKESNAWYPWEWVNPPMKLGVEYRTTERYLDKPVYAQIINCGSMPAIGSEKTTSIAAFNVDVVTFISGWCTYYGLVIEPNIFGMALSANSSDIIIANLSREVNSNAVIFTLVKYTKKTD